MQVLAHWFRSRLSRWGLLFFVVVVTGCGSDNNGRRDEPLVQTPEPVQTPDLVWDEGNWDELNWQ